MGYDWHLSGDAMTESTHQIFHRQLMQRHEAQMRGLTKDLMELRAQVDQCLSEISSSRFAKVPLNLANQDGMLQVRLTSFQKRLAMVYLLQSMGATSK
jgi:hypothetical protein